MITAALIHLLIVIAVLALIAVVAFWIINQIGLPAPFGNVALIIVGIILLVALLLAAQPVLA